MNINSLAIMSTCVRDKFLVSLGIKCLGMTVEDFTVRK